MSKIVSLASGREYSVEQLLEIVDDLRESIASGEVIAFAAVGIVPGNAPPRQWTGAARVVSPLMMLGAITKLQRSYADE